MEKHIIAERLKEAREAIGMSQKTLAEKVGLTKAAISQYENGHHVPGVEHSYAIAQELGVSFNWLIGYSEYRYKIEAQHITEVYYQLSDEHKKELYNFAEYLQRKDAEAREDEGE